MGFPSMYHRGELEVLVLVRLHKPDAQGAQRAVWQGLVLADEIDLANNPVTGTIEVTIGGTLLDGKEAG